METSEATRERLQWEFRRAGRDVNEAFSAMMAARRLFEERETEYRVAHKRLEEFAEVALEGVGIRRLGGREAEVKPLRLAILCFVAYALTMFDVALSPETGWISYVGSTVIGALFGWTLPELYYLARGSK